MKRALWAPLLAAPLLVLLAFGFARNPDVASSPLLHHQASAIHLRTLDNAPFSLASLRGKPVVLNFWASWCLGCKIEHPYLVQAWHAYRREGAAFVGIVYQDTASNARAFLRERGGGWLNLQDPDQRTAIDYGVYGVPETFFIDRRGVIRDKSTGPVTPELLSRDIQQLLQSKP
jgi:cytochrome c biogenesis protein CcmG/thiol:disulfide interchange protein DsbE